MWTKLQRRSLICWIFRRSRMVVGTLSYSSAYNSTLLALSLVLLWNHSRAALHSPHIAPSNRRYSPDKSLLPIGIDLKNEEAVSGVQESQLELRPEKGNANPEGDKKFAIENMKDAAIITSRVRRSHKRLKEIMNFKSVERQPQQNGWLPTLVRLSRKLRETDEDESDMPSVEEDENMSNERFERFRLMMISSAITATILAIACLLISIWIVAFQRLSINRRLILLNEKVNALEERLGTRQLPEALLTKMCQMVGANYEIIKEERQKAAQDIANDERMLLNESVNAANEAQYDTMHEIRNDVFGNKVDKLSATEYESAPKKVSNDPEKSAKKVNFNERIQKKSSSDGYECYGGEVPPLAIDLKKPTKARSPPNEAAERRPDQTQDNEHAVVKKKTPTAVAAGDANELPPKKPAETGAEDNKNLEIRAPAVGAVADVNDPNYATLHGLDNKKIFTTKKAANAEAIKNEANLEEKVNLEIRRPAFPAVADVDDPNYETLRGIDNDKVFTVKNKRE
uniref:Uncharacterized protein n=1 Tax=Parascaris univalens TaxID=6257 RepID=A0A915BBU3_PARUN